jgi:serine protease Do
MGVSFAIPIDVAMDVSNQLKAGGKVSRGWLGVVIQEVSKDLAESFGLEKPAGALVAQIQDDGPAAKGGLQVGDVILSMNGQPIIMSADLPHLIRDGKRKNVELTVGAIPDEGAELDSPLKSGAEASSNRLGVAVGDLTAEQKKTYDLKGGVVIKEVQDGPAELIGLQPGDIITHLNNQAISDSKQFTEIAKALPKNRSVSMRVLRQGRASFITFKLAE